MKKILFIAALVLLAACGKEGKQIEKSEETTAEIEAAQMEGRDAARAFVGREWRDTLDLQRQLLEVRAKQSKYVMEKKQKCAEAFDSTFVSTIRTVRPDLAPHLR